MSKMVGLQPVGMDLLLLLLVSQLYSAQCIIICFKKLKLTMLIVVILRSTYCLSCLCSTLFPSLFFPFFTFSTLRSSKTTKLDLVCMQSGYLMFDCDVSFQLSSKFYNLSLIRKTLFTGCCYFSLK